MSARIIIENNGEWYVCDGLTIDIQNKSILYVSDGTANAMASYVTLTPVKRTDNSDVIARLEDENKRLKDEIDDLHIERERLMWRVSTYWSALEPIAAVSILPPIGENGMPHIADIVHCVDAVKASKNILNGGCAK